MATIMQIDHQQHTAQPQAHVSPAAQKALYAIMAIAIVRFWLMPLGSSFWVDEAGTFWTVKDGLRSMLERMQLWPNTPPLFGIISWAAYKIGGAHEYALRLPSVVAMGIGCWLLSRLTARLLDSASVLPTVAVFICLQPVVVAATEARPYAMVLALGIGATLAIVRWLDSGSAGYAAAYVAAGVLLLYTHPLTFPLILSHALYALMRLREGTPVQGKQLAGAALAIGILMFPQLPILLGYGRGAGSHIFLRRPYFAHFAETLVPDVLIMGVGLGLFIAWRLSLTRHNGRLSLSPRFEPIPPSSQVLLFALLMVPAGLFFAVSVFTPVKTFHLRYIIVSNIGLALLAGGAIGRLQPAWARNIVTSCVLLCSLAAYGAVGRLWPLHHNQDWRGALALVKQNAAPTGLPVIFQSPYIESTTLLQSSGDDPPEFLIAPVVMYPVQTRVIPVPLAFNQRSIGYMNAKVIPVAEQAGRFLLVTVGGGWEGPEGSEQPYVNWLLGRLPDFQARKLGNFGDAVSITLYQQDGNPATSSE
ncbi:MAG: glycosyltransferase family 39 protein [Acidobacteria bacterium]|nr:glycosyltransferase family 39 protein [Acidobacteriota bacterium]